MPKPDQQVEIPLNTFWRNQITITTSYAAAPADLLEAIDLIESKRVIVKDMVTHLLPLEKVQEGFDLTVNPKESLKVVLLPNGGI